MYLNGLRTDAQSLGDRLGTRAFSNKCENLTLAHGQHSIVLNGSPDIPSQFFKHHRCDGWANIAFAGRYRADSVEQLGRGIGLDHISGGAGFPQRLDYVLLIIVLAQNQNPRPGNLLAQMVGSLDSTQALHPDVQQNHVRARADRDADAFQGVARFARQKNSILLFQHDAQRVAQQAMVIDNEDPDCLVQLHRSATGIRAHSRVLPGLDSSLQLPPRIPTRSAKPRSPKPAPPPLSRTGPLSLTAAKATPSWHSTSISTRLASA